MSSHSNLDLDSTRVMSDDISCLPPPYSSDLFSDLKTPEDDDVDIEIECCGVSRQSEDKWGIEVGADGVRRESR